MGDPIDTIIRQRNWRVRAFHHLSQEYLRVVVRSGKCKTCKKGETCECEYLYPNCYQEKDA